MARRDSQLFQKEIEGESLNFQSKSSSIKE